jgi:hypothetical protein
MGAQRLVSQEIKWPRAFETNGGAGGGRTRVSSADEGERDASIDRNDASVASSEVARPGMLTADFSCPSSRRRVSRS